MNFFYLSKPTIVSLLTFILCFHIAPDILILATYFNTIYFKYSPSHS